MATFGDPRLGDRVVKGVLTTPAGPYKLKLLTGHLLVNLGFPIFSFSDFEIFDVCKNEFEEIWFSKYRRKKDKGVVGGPRTKLGIVWAISATLKFQFTEHHEI